MKSTGATANDPQALELAYALKHFCKARKRCFGCLFYIVYKDDIIPSCSVLEPRYWKLPRRKRKGIAKVNWPDVQVELVVAATQLEDSPKPPRHGRQRVHAILDARLAAILEGIVTHGSLNKTAKNMRLSYSHATALINEAEESFGFPLTIGISSRGSKLTPKAEKLLAAYKKAQSKTTEIIERNYSKELGIEK